MYMPISDVEDGTFEEGPSRTRDQPPVGHLAITHKAKEQSKDLRAKQRAERGSISYKDRKERVRDELRALQDIVKRKVAADEDKFSKLE